MCPFSVTVPHVPDRELGPLLTQLADAGFESPIIKHVGADVPSDDPSPPARGKRADLPEDWRLVRDRGPESYRWPKGRDLYSPYRVFMATTRTEGAVQIGRASCRERVWIPV